ncbi:MAG: serine/threonine protein kinase, partial [Chloroflexi bacterium]|nr:serine/threonine protein kinase [Chloroflexota bacterium]
NPQRLHRFRNEVEDGLRLDHKNIIKVIDWDLDAAPPYIVSSHYKGGSLSAARPFEFSSHSRLLDLFGQVCDGVLYAHGEGVVHRDLKPENIFLSNDPSGDAVVGDFGLCHVEDGERITVTQEPIGGRYYMAPEWEDGPVERVTPQCDVYSLGKILYWLMSEGKTFSREKHRDQRFDLASRTQDIYMEHVSRLLDHMILVEPNRRWPLDVVRDQVTLTKRLVVGEYNPAGPKVLTRCTYCGIGQYMMVGRDVKSAIPLGLLQEGASGEWRFLVCSHCAHVQSFRPDISRRNSLDDKTPWDEPTD